MSAEDQVPQVSLSPRLQPREREIVSLLAKGYSSKEIAAKLDLKYRVVCTYIYSACIKTGARNRVDLAVRRAEFGVVD